MAYDMTKKRAMTRGDIELKNGDGSPMLDDEGCVLSVTLHSPAAKQWQAANADLNRKRAERLQKNGGRVSAAALDNASADQIEFLTRITISFNGWDYPVPEGDKGADAMFRAAYGDDALGFVRDHVWAEAHDWSAFTKGSATS